MEITRRNLLWCNFLEVCFRTPGTSQKLLQKSALRCIRLLSVSLSLMIKKQVMQKLVAAGLQSLSLSDLHQKYFRQEQRAQRLTFWAWRLPVGMGSYTRRGGGSKSPCPPSKVCFPHKVGGTEGGAILLDFCSSLDPFFMQQKRAFLA